METATKLTSIIYFVHLMRTGKFTQNSNRNIKRKKMPDLKKPSIFLKEKNSLSQNLSGFFACKNASIFRICQNIRIQIICHLLNKSNGKSELQSVMEHHDRKNRIKQTNPIKTINFNKNFTSRNKEHRIFITSEGKRESKTN